MLRTPFRDLAACPRNGRALDPAPLCRAVLRPEYAAGLGSIEGFSHLILLYWLGPQTPRLAFVPPFDGQARGVFATRAPWRPNPIGLSVVALEAVEPPATLAVRFLDCLDGTPLLDVKPYLASTDAEPAARPGWLAPHLRPRREPLLG